MSIGEGLAPGVRKDHLEWDTGIGLPNPASVKVTANAPGSCNSTSMPAPADPAGDACGKNGSDFWDL